MRSAVDLSDRQDEPQNASIDAGNLSELELMLGDVSGALRTGKQAVEFADRSGDEFERVVRRTVSADALHQAGRRAEALARFDEAEVMQFESPPKRPLLYSVWGFRYCDLLLAECERAAWQLQIGRASRRPSRTSSRSRPDGSLGLPDVLQRCREVEQRAAKTLEWAEQAAMDVLGAALNRLTLGRAALYRAGLTDSKTDHAEGVETARRELAAAVDGLRRAGTQDHIPRGLLSRAWLLFLAGNADGARADLDEAWQIAERGPMRLFMADIHLHRARLFHAQQPYPWESPRHDLAEARRLIEECGYHRRDEELADAERAAESW
jgi:tetratricopeptide (TPR) repeat protein